MKQQIKDVLSAYTKISDTEFEKFFKLYSSMPYYSETMDVRTDNVLFVYVFTFLAATQYNKEGTYGNSWEKRKEIGVFMNLARKFDRIENMMISDAKDEVGESKADTVGDQSNYGILWLTYIMRNQPDEFDKWVQEVLGQAASE